MNQNELTRRMEQLIAGGLPPEEAQALWQQIKANPDWRRKFAAVALGDHLSQSPAAPQARALLATIRQEQGPLPPLSLNWWDQVRFTWAEWPWWTKVGLIVVLVGMLILAGLRLVSHPVPPADLVNRFAEPPWCSSLAGGSTALLPTPLEDDLYCQGQYGKINDLARQSSAFSLAKYYQAHIDLQQGRYAAAELGLENCLANRTLLQAAGPDYYRGDQLTLNLVLARYARHQSVRRLRQELRELAAAPNTTGLIREKIQDLLKALRPRLNGF